MVILKKRRGKANLLKKFETGDKKFLWRDAEDLALSLIQLWADTFMMKEDSFPGF